MARPLPPPGRTRRREDSRYETPTRDPYRLAGKPPQPASCPRCGLVFRDGRWLRSLYKPSPTRLCPACRRQEDRNPAGEVRIGGPFVADHRSELLATLQGAVKRESAEHPLERVDRIREEGDEIVVTTTGVHVARAIGQALRRAWDGTLDIEDDHARLGVLVRWRR